MSTKNNTNTNPAIGARIDVKGFYHPGYYNFEGLGTLKERLPGGGIAVEFKNLDGKEPATADYTPAEAIQILSRSTNPTGPSLFLRDLNGLEVVHGAHMKDITVRAVGARLGLDVGRAILALPGLVCAIKEALLRLEARGGDLGAEKAILKAALGLMEPKESTGWNPPKDSEFMATNVRGMQQNIQNGRLGP